MICNESIDSLASTQHMNHKLKICMPLHSWNHKDVAACVQLNHIGQKVAQMLIEYGIKGKGRGKADSFKFL